MTAKKRKYASKKGLHKRMETSAATKDGFARTDAFNYPKDTEFYKPKKGRNKIRIVPFVIKNENHPLIKKGISEIGDLDYVMDIHVHRRVGACNQDVICLQRNYGLPCPLCDEANSLRENGNEDGWKNLKASRRVMYNVLDKLDGGDEIKIFTTSHYLFEKELISEAQYDAEEEGGEMVDFSDVYDGKIIEFRGDTAKIGKNEYLEFASFKFKEDKKDVEEFVGEALSFDDIMISRDAAAIEALVFGADDDDAEDRNENDDEQEPSKRKKKKAHTEPDDVEEDDTDEEPPKKKRKGKKCPHGYTYGEDGDEYEECDNCKYYESCVAKTQEG